MEKAKTSRRPHMSIEDARQLVERWRTSGLSQAAFARSEGCVPAVVYRAVRRVSQSDGSPHFTPVTYAQDDGVSAGADDVRWDLPQGLGSVFGSSRGMGTVLALVLRGDL